MRLDHIVVRTPDRDAVVSALAGASGLPAMNGYGERGAPVSRGVRFANGPFFDIFPWPVELPPREPLVGLEDKIGRAQDIAARRGWRTALHRRDDVDEAERPPWSTLSFRRGQGLISSLFVIEYEDDPAAWRNLDFSGPLYLRHGPSAGGATLSRVVIGCDDLAGCRAQIEALSAAPMPLVSLEPAAGANAGFARAEIDREGAGSPTIIWRHQR